MINISSFFYVNVQLPSSNLANTHHNTAATNDFETGHGDSAECAANADYDTDNDTVDHIDDDYYYFYDYNDDDDDDND